MYVEFGTSATDSITLLHTYGDTSTKAWDILARQIACTASWKAPTDCLQYFTAVAGNIKNYNFGNQILQAQNYNNCIREGSGYCRIQWKQSSITSPDPFQLDTQAAGSATAAGGSAPGGAVTCAQAYVQIPDGSDDGLTPIPTFFSTWPFQPQWCGSVLGYTGVAAPLNPATTIVSARQPFTLGVWTIDGTAMAPGGTGFSLDYTQLPC